MGTENAEFQPMTEDRYRQALAESKRQKDRAEKAEAEVERLQKKLRRFYEKEVRDYCAACQGIIEDEDNSRILHCQDQHVVHRECENALMLAGQFNCPACHEPQAL